MIAITGMALRFPGADTPERFWELLRSGSEGISRFPERPDLPGYVPARGVVLGLERFEPELFGMTPSEARAADPQHLLFLQLAWEALANGGYHPHYFEGRIGVFGGAATNHHWNLAMEQPETARLGALQLAIVNEVDFLTTRVSYHFGLTGPSLVVQGACSTSLVALHTAAQSLANGECDLALVGAVSIRLPQESGYQFVEGGILSPDGHCRPFDREAAGTVSSNGAAVLVLRRLEEARAERDTIRAVLRGSAVNHDGAQKIGYTAPNPTAQAEVMQLALTAAGVTADLIGMIEAHGTATRLGDSVEARALSQVYRGGPFWLGSVKSNLGHLNTAAGMAGLVKTILSLEAGQVPPTLHFREFHPELGLDPERFQVPTVCREWPQDRERVAAVSSIGLGGTNAHAVLSQAPERLPPVGERARVFLLSAASESALESLESATHCSTEEAADVSFTLRVGRSPLEWRSCSSDTSNWIRHRKLESPRLLFLYPGIGDHDPEMGRALYQQESVFRESLRECDRLLQGGLLKRLYGDGREAPALGGVWAHLAVVAVEVALTDLLRSWGFEPEATLGHSLGELTSAYAAGLWSRAELLQVVRARAEAVEKLPPSAQLVVPLAAERMELKPGLHLCLENGPQLTVVAGSEEAVTAYQEELRQAGVPSRKVAGGRAYHTPLAGPAGERLKQVLAGIDDRHGAVPWLSNVDGDWRHRADGDHWLRHLVSPARFDRALERLTQEPDWVLLEVGPGTSLQSLARQRGLTRVSSCLGTALEVDRNDRRRTLLAVGELWSWGLDGNLRALDPEGGRVPLAPYPFGLTVPAPPASPAALPGDPLAKLWCEVLGLEEIGEEDNFFRLGGNSLLALQLTHRMRSELGLRLSLGQFLENPTLSAQRERSFEVEESRPPELVVDPDGAHQPFPLTEVQQAYWVGRRGEFGAGVATHGYAEVESDIEPAVMEEAWNRLIAHHPMLRAVTTADGRQKVLDSVDRFRIERVEPGRELEIREELESRVVDLQQWPWCRVVAIPLPSGQTRFCISFDLLFGDAGSWQSFFAQLHLLCRDPGATLPSCGLSFRDYVLTEERLRNSASYQRSLQYWRDRLESLPPAPELPLNEGLESSAFDRLSGRLEPLLWESLKRRARQLELTPSSVLLGAFARVLAHWSRSRHFTLNLTLFHRQPLHPEIDHLFGDFTSLALLEANLEEETTFSRGCLSLQQQLWQDLEHRQVTGVRVLRELRRRRGLRPGPLMPVVFTSTLALGPEGTDASVPGQLAKLGTMVYAISQTPQVWLDHQVFEKEGALCFNWDFPQGLFQEEVIEDIFQAYQKLLERLAGDEALWSQTRLNLTPDRHRRLNERLNDTGAEIPAEPCYASLWRQYLNQPGAVAVTDAQRSWSYADLWRRAQGLAEELRGRGFAGGAPVAVINEKGGDQVAAVLGVFLAGGFYCPMACDDPRLKSCLQSAGIDWMVSTEPELASLVRHFLDWRQVGEAEPEFRAAAPESLAYLIFTSGSTGLPKASAITHLSVVNRMVDMERRLGLGPDTVGLALAPLHFDLSVFDIFGVLGCGGRLVYTHPDRQRDPSHWFELMEREGVTLWNSVPAFMEMLLDWTQGRQLPPSLRWTILSGDFIAPSLPERLAGCSSTQLLSGGGATETTVWDICHPITEHSGERPVPYGTPMVNARYYVLDSRGEPRPAGVVGELFAAGVGLAQSYWQSPELTEERFPTHPRLGRLYRTGDLGLLSKRGWFEIKGRADQRLKIRGVRVEAGEVEGALIACPRLERVAVVARGEPGLQKLYAYYQGPATPGQIREWAQAKLPSSMVPSVFVALETLPLGPTGKVDRKALPEATPESPVARGPVAESSRTLALVQEVLGVTLGVEANLIEAGATSVDMVRLANRIEDEYGLRPPLDLLYEGASAQAIAAGIQQVTGTHLALGSLRDPEEQERFRAERRWHRQLSGRRFPLEPAAPAVDRRSCRRYKLTPIEAPTLAAWLSCLAEGDRGFQYPSAGGLQPVQAYLYLKPGRVDGFPGGAYYYDPAAHQLVCLAPGAEISRKLYGLHPNRPIFDEAALALFLVADLAAIEPIYGSYARDFALLEAGYMGQLLMEQAQRHRLGLCPIGSLNFEPLEELFQLGGSHQLVHSLLGGIPEDRETRAEGAERLLEQVKGLSPEQVTRMLKELN